MLKSGISLKGEYNFIINVNVPGKGTIELKTPKRQNKITSDGMNFVLGRIIDNNTKVISHIALSTKKDQVGEWSGEKARRVCKAEGNPLAGMIKFIADFTSLEFNGTHSLGLFNIDKDGKVLAHGILDKAVEGLPADITVTVNYTLGFKGV